jgi:LuxR family maltose regulon positive regulatory protein
MRASFIRDIDLVIRESQAALDLLPSEHHVEILHSLTGLIDGTIAQGRFSATERLLDEASAVRKRLPPLQIWWDAHVDLLQADALALTGRLDEAYRAFAARLDALSGQTERHRGKIRYRMAAIALERHSLDDALALTAEPVPEISTRFEAIYWYPEAWMIRARVLHALRRAGEAREELDRAITFAKDHGLYRIMELGLALRAAWDLGEGIEGGRLTRLPRQSPDVTIESMVFGEIDTVFSDISGLIARHDFEGALRVLKQTQDLAKERGRVDVEVRARVLRAAVHLLAGGEDATRRATRALQAAIEVGRIGGFVQSFLDPGVDLRAVLDRAGFAPGDAGYISKIRSAMDETFGNAPQLVEGITSREREVLQLLSLGASNDEIGSRLFISPNTVKKHMVRINRKLGTANRTAALLRAKQLGIL